MKIGQRLPQLCAIKYGDVVLWNTMYFLGDRSNLKTQGSTEVSNRRSIVSFQFTQTLRCHCTCVKPRIHLAIRVNTGCKFGTLWLAGCRWPTQATSSWLVGVFTSRDWNLRRLLEYRRLWEINRGNSHKYELLWKSDLKDYGKHGPRLVAWKKTASTLQSLLYIIQFILHK